MEQKRILITGASGFIGSTVVDKALEMGYETWAGIRASSNKVYLQDERIKFIDLNYADKKKLKEQLRDFAGKNGRFDYIVHSAGITKAIRKLEFDKVNYEQMRNCGCAYRNGCRSRFVHFYEHIRRYWRG